MYLSDLQNKDIVSIKDGRKIGRIIDAYIDNDGKLQYLVIEEKKSFRNMISSKEDVKISFSQITKFGEDVILVDL